MSILSAIGALVGAVGTVGGQALTSGLNYISQRNTNKKNASIAAANNDVLIDLANTAHQREVDDLKTAGLNPILSAGGTGAATPGLQQPDLKAPQIDPYIISETLKSLSEAKLNNANAILSEKESGRVSSQIYADQARAKLDEANAKQIEIDNAYKDKKNQKEIEKLEWEKDKLIAEADHYRMKLYESQTTTAGKAIENSKLAEKIDEEIKYTRERSRGRSKSRSYSTSVGVKGISDSQSYSQTW